ncbi:MAG: hypothetical protein AB1486_32285 [Planctomycetota bacterium]
MSNDSHAGSQTLICSRRPGVVLGVLLLCWCGKSTLQDQIEAAYAAFADCGEAGDFDAIIRKLETLEHSSAGQDSALAFELAHLTLRCRARQGSDGVLDALERLEQDYPGLMARPEPYLPPVEDLVKGHLGGNAANLIDELKRRFPLEASRLDKFFRTVTDPQETGVVLRLTGGREDDRCDEFWVEGAQLANSRWLQETSPTFHSTPILCSPPSLATAHHIVPGRGTVIGVRWYEDLNACSIDDENWDKLTVAFAGDLPPDGQRIHLEDRDDVEFVYCHGDCSFPYSGIGAVARRGTIVVSRGQDGQASVEFDVILECIITWDGKPRDPVPWQHEFTARRLSLDDLDPWLGRPCLPSESRYAESYPPRTGGGARHGVKRDR